MQEAVRAEIWESNVRVLRIKYYSLVLITESAGKSSLPRNESLKLSDLQMSFVLSGLNRT